MTRLRRIALTIVVGVLVTLPTAGTALAGVSGSSGSSHREAPRILLDPVADNTDETAGTARAGVTLPSSRGTGTGPFTT
jgi:hypothetical protein